MSGIEDWLVGLSKQDFVTDYFQPPCAVAAGASGYRHLCDWQSVDAVVDISAKDLTGDNWHTDCG